MTSCFSGARRWNHPESARHFGPSSPSISAHVILPGNHTHPRLDHGDVRRISRLTSSSTSPSARCRSPRVTGGFPKGRTSPIVTVYLRAHRRHGRCRGLLAGRAPRSSVPRAIVDGRTCTESFRRSEHSRAQIPTSACTFPPESRRGVDQAVELGAGPMPLLASAHRVTINDPDLRPSQTSHR